VPLGVLLDVLPREPVDDVTLAVGGRNPGAELVRCRILAARHREQRIGGRLAGLGQGREAGEGELARLTSEAVAHRP
jgi:hypothetical protein